jgi:hypothetical protein
MTGQTPIQRARPHVEFHVAPELESQGGDESVDKASMNT